MKQRRTVAGLGGLLLLLFAAWLLREGDDRAPRPIAPKEPVDRDPIAPPVPAVPAVPPAGTPEFEGPPEEGGVRVRTNVPGVRLTLRVECYGGADPAPVTVTAGEDGSARLELPDLDGVRGQVTVEATDPRFFPRLAVVKDGRAELELRPGVVATGRIVDRDGRPVPRALAMVEGRPYRLSDEEGRFRVWEVAGVERGVLVVRADGFLPVRREIGFPSTDLLVTLEPDESPTISGRVTFPDGRPVAGIRVRGKQGWLFADDVTDPEGRYLLRCREEGEYEVWLEPGPSDRSTAPRGATGVDLVYSRHLVEVRARTEDGRPFQRAWVAGRGHGAAEGSVVRFGAEPDGELQLVLLAPGHEPVRRALRLDGRPRRHEVDLVLRPGTWDCSLDLRVTRADGSVPDRIGVALTPVNGAHPPPFLIRRDLSPDRFGHLVIRELPPGRYTAVVSVGRGAPDAKVDVELFPDARTEAFVRLP